MTRIALEICVDDPAGINAAVAGGADRIELCAALALGGLTPSWGLMRIAAGGGLPVMAMIRPRSGNFIWSAAEMRTMISDIDAARRAGLAGVVIGASLSDGTLDADRLRRLMEAARGLDVTLHRAIDLTPDPVAAMALCRQLGINRVLSSGGALNALAGQDRLARMMDAASGVTVMPAGGVSADNVCQLAAHLPLSEIHASCSALLPTPPDARLTQFGFQPDTARHTDVQKVRQLRDALDSLAAAPRPLV